jgi:hypothetical protein
MFKDLYWLIILLIFALFFYYSNKNNKQYSIHEGFKNSKVYLRGSPIKTKTNDILNVNEINFASGSIYEVGKIDYPYNYQH